MRIQCYMSFPKKYIFIALGGNFWLLLITNHLRAGPSLVTLIMKNCNWKLKQKKLLNNQILQLTSVR